MLRVLMAVLLVVSGAAWAGDLEDCWQAYWRGDYPVAVDKCRRAAERGESKAQYQIGLFYQHGLGVRKDYQEAMRWFQAAAKQGNRDANNDIAQMYYAGQGVPQNYAEAIRWYKKAASAGHVGAQLDLGWMYERGEGVAQDFTRAHMWYNLASAVAEGVPQRARDSIAAKMTPQQIAEAQRMASECMAKKYQGCD